MQPSPHDFIDYIILNGITEPQYAPYVSFQTAPGCSSHALKILEILQFSQGPLPTTRLIWENFKTIGPIKDIRVKLDCGGDGGGTGRYKDLIQGGSEGAKWISCTAGVLVYFENERPVI